MCLHCTGALSVDLRTSLEWTVRASGPPLSGQWKRVWDTRAHSVVGSGPPAATVARRTEDTFSVCAVGCEERRGSSRARSGWKRRRQRSVHVPVTGSPTREAAAQRLFVILVSYVQYHAAMRQVRALDELRSDDWRPSRPPAGFGSSQLRVVGEADRCAWTRGRLWA